ncbi:DUF6053 domain-containing protein [Lysobacter enzymogenes]|uniref:DUF6053 domain-containing protein n=1 Tax=Lysobacter enzymogenes TaxID=69 RepID=UPI003D18B946
MPASTAPGSIPVRGAAGSKTRNDRSRPGASEAGCATALVGGPSGPIAVVAEPSRPIALVGGPSGPMLFAQVALIGAKSIGPEGPPTRAKSMGPGDASGASARSAVASQP